MKNSSSNTAIGFLFCLITLISPLSASAGKKCYVGLAGHDYNHGGDNDFRAPIKNLGKTLAKNGWEMTEIALATSKEGGITKEETQQIFDPSTYAGCDQVLFALSCHGMGDYNPQTPNTGSYYCNAGIGYTPSDPRGLPTLFDQLQKSGVKVGMVAHSCYAGAAVTAMPEMPGVCVIAGGHANTPTYMGADDSHRDIVRFLNTKASGKGDFSLADVTQDYSNYWAAKRWSNSMGSIAFADMEPQMSGLPTKEDLSYLPISKRPLSDPNSCEIFFPFAREASLWNDIQSIVDTNPSQIPEPCRSKYKNYLAKTKDALTWVNQNSKSAETFEQAKKIASTQSSPLLTQLDSFFKANPDFEDAELKDTYQRLKKLMDRPFGFDEYHYMRSNPRVKSTDPKKRVTESLYSWPMDEAEQYNPYYDLKMAVSDFSYQLERSARKTGKEEDFAQAFGLDSDWARKDWLQTKVGEEYIVKFESMDKTSGAQKMSDDIIQYKNAADASRENLAKTDEKRRKQNKNYINSEELKDIKSCILKTLGSGSPEAQAYLKKHPGAQACRDFKI